jgi:glycosyltransferase involved in cell wall biosynthesis
MGWKENITAKSRRRKNTMGKPPKKIIVCVTNDLTTDQRVDRSCTALVKMGFEVLLIGRKLEKSLPLEPRTYRMKRMKLLFNNGPLFYAEYNLRLLFFLLTHKVDVLFSNDLDTLPANYLASGIRHLPLIHDCHEYFRGMPELNGRGIVTRIWKFLEDHTFPKLKTVMAVNASIAEIYHKEYGNEIKVIRNVPVTKPSMQPKKKSDLGIREDQKVILYQGAVNIDRGLEEAIQAMRFVKSNAVFLIIGTGDIFEKLKQLVIDPDLTSKVILTGQIPFQQLHSWSLMADIGLSIEKDVSLNYHYSLPNKFLDYIQAGVPVLISPMPEMLAIVEKYNIGGIISSHDPMSLAGKFDEMLENTGELARFRENTRKAATDLCWEKEEKEFIKIFEPYA